MTPRVRPAILLAAGGAALAAVLWAVLTPAPAPAVAVAPAAPPRPATAAPRLRSLAEWEATMDARPLFDPARHPPPQPRLEAAAAPPDPPRLTAVLIGPFGRLATFVGGDGRAVTLGEGGRIGAWSVRAISAGEVVIEDADGALRLHPSFGPPAPARGDALPPQRA